MLLVMGYDGRDKFDDFFYSLLCALAGDRCCED
jgi:hypothetical protein